MGKELTAEVFRCGFLFALRPKNTFRGVFL